MCVRVCVCACVRVCVRVCDPCLAPFREGCPGQKECDQAIDTLNSTLTQLNQAVLSATSQQLQPSAASTLQGFQVCCPIYDCLSRIVMAAPFSDPRSKCCRVWPTLETVSSLSPTLPRGRQRNLGIRSDERGSRILYVTYMYSSLPPSLSLSLSLPLSLPLSLSPGDIHVQSLPSSGRGGHWSCLQDS